MKLALPLELRPIAKRTIQVKEIFIMVAAGEGPKHGTD